MNNNQDPIDENDFPEEISSDNELNKVNENLSSVIKKRISQSSKNNVAKKSMIKALLPIITYVIVFIIILIIIIGIILFFITMPGMVMDKLKNLSIKIGNKIAAFFGGDTTEQIEKQQIYDVLDYLEEMGYDLKGYGFLTDYVGDSDDGIKRNDEGKIDEAKSEFVSAYLASDNYIYTIANFNQINDAANNGHRILGGLISIFQKVLNLATNGQLGQYWGRGMLSIYHESSLGVPGTYYGGFDDWLGWSDIKIDIDEEKDEKKLKIRRGYGSENKEFNLDGWTGRYGMPLEFLLSLHLATMMPDLAYDMVENFDTQVVILLHNSGHYLDGTAEYDPYIAYVKNHWYRDVYFVQTDKEFVDYDYEYEAITKERWTLYETYTEEDNNPEKLGEYKLYELDENGEYKKQNGEYVLFEGTQEDADKQNKIVAKKAVTLKYNDEEDFEAIDWNTENGKWTAYKIQSGNIVQTGEGLRTETNADIKKMFLENTYFRYDGSQETAEIITKLRKQKNLDYGALEKDDLNKKIRLNGKEYKVSEFSGQVSLNQDSLNAFSMLENEHTLDSDYIYRDFKELIVELGYFNKEELTDETPKLLQWIIPKIGSYGYPKRELDKRENEYGTMAHSKYDYTSENVQDVVENITPESEGGTGEFDDDETETQPDTPPATETIDSTTEGGSGELEAYVNSKVEGEVKRLSTQKEFDLLENNQTAINLTDEVGSSDGYVSKNFEEAGWEETGALVKELSADLNINTINKYYEKGNTKQYESFVQSLGGVFSELRWKRK